MNSDPFGHIACWRHFIQHWRGQMKSGGSLDMKAIWQRAIEKGESQIEMLEAAEYGFWNSPPFMGSFSQPNVELTEDK